MSRRAKTISLALAALLCVALISTPATAAVTVEDVLADVSGGQYAAYQLTVESMGLGLYGGPAYDQGIRNRDGWSGDGTLGNQEARLYLTDTFGAMGMDVTIQGTYQNVVAEMPGTQTPEKIYIISGHYDHVGGDRPGGDDNASGTAGVLEAARVLSRYHFRSTIRFIGFNAEEDGLLGSRDYVNNVVQPNNEEIAGVVNLDMILRPGWDNNPGEPSDLDVATRSINSCLDWADVFIAAAETYVPSLPIDEAAPYTSSWGSSDHQPFANNGYPALMAIENKASEIWGGAHDYYHTAEDASDRLANDPDSPSGVIYDYAFATDVVRASVATIALSAELAPAPGDANFDGFVDDDDLSVLLSNWGRTVDWSWGDFNADHTVDDDDLGALLSNWAPASEAAAAAIPEPATLALLAAAAPLLAARRRRRTSTASRP